MIKMFDHQLIVDADTRIWKSLIEAERNPAPEKPNSSSKSKSRPKSPTYQAVLPEQRSRILAAVNSGIARKKISEQEGLPIAIVRRVIHENDPKSVKKKPCTWDYSLPGRALSLDGGRYIR